MHMKNISIIRHLFENKDYLHDLKFFEDQPFFKSKYISKDYIMYRFIIMPIFCPNCISH